ncbi:protein SAWADEE HOMEODOMAIN HOMOLOG 1-like isoform X3 [Carica papaya]|uniref:protein SAWADEE HOMEODOMAIN HOMOLOG 1-like isoform X3 n=1 Tax=Carica papaya TaxID=3649 RepID=UPI000B8CE90C|nr:protein SAWADEE HOMEODOMAIN HOMOLOG 1-like isoform X3 [Carica papaya]
MAIEDVGSARISFLLDQEVRVRFSGFRNTDDEWVNVRRGVRERSIPLEPSECHRVKFRDLVLCFQDREAQSIYFDAHIIEIQRHLHDPQSCSCIFRVRYDHDGTEENVGLERICCRPMQH